MTDIHIPPAALEAGARAIEQSLLTSQMSAAEPVYAAEARAAFLAMIAAWPNMKLTPWWEFTTHKKRVDLILPIPEKPDAEA